MRLSPSKGRRPLRAWLRSIASAQEGSFLVEALASAVILVIVGLGVLESLDRGTHLGGEQKVQAVAGNVAQSEQEGIRALPVAKQSNLQRTSTREVGEVTYTIDSRANWVNDRSGDANCTTAGSSADYMKLTTVVTWPQMGARKPITLESLISPGVRAFTADQGSLAVTISDRNGAAVSGLQLGLDGPGTTLSDPTNDAGCVLWGYLPAGGGYELGFERTPDWVTADGDQVAAIPVSVVGAQTSNVEFQYDRGGRLATRFVTKRFADGPFVETNPKVAHVSKPGGGFVGVDFPITSSGGTSGLLFPFSGAYTIHADSCESAEVPVPAPMPVPGPLEGFPDAPLAVAATVRPGETTTSDDVQLPALNIQVLSDGEPKAGLDIRVRTPCGTVYDRKTIEDGEIDDPGFPYAFPAGLQICASDGARHETVTETNVNFNVTRLLIELTDDDLPGACT